MKPRVSKVGGQWLVAFNGTWKYHGLDWHDAIDFAIRIGRRQEPSPC